jgi:hypothetical protein
MKSLTKILITIVMLQLVAMAMTATTVKAMPDPVVTVSPASVTIPNVGDTAVVDIDISGVADNPSLFSYEIKVWFLNSVLNCTTANVTRPAGHFLEPVDPANQQIPKWECNSTYNATHGRIWAAFSLTAPEVGRSGNGVLFEIVFTGVGTGTSPIVLNDQPGSSGPVKLAGYPDGLPITHTATDGSIEVVPEFPIFLLLPILVITSAVTIPLSRLCRRRKI